MTRDTGRESASATVGTSPEAEGEQAVEVLVDGQNAAAAPDDLGDLGEEPLTFAGGRLTSVAAESPTDGRLLRSQRTKRAIVDALLDLIREGHMKPSSAEIADRAGVTQRTLFNQFGDMDSLLRAIAARHAARVTPMIPNITSGTLTERSHEFCTQLAGLLEEVMQIRWAIITNSTSNERLGRGTEVLTQVLRHQMQETFGNELRQLDEADRSATLDLLEIEADPITWRLRRFQQRKTVEEAADALERAINLVLRADA
jgi:AcrR family transcriptional regulator